jgi:hypothetical protein
MRTNQRAGLAAALALAATLGAEASGGSAPIPGARPYGGGRRPKKRKGPPYNREQEAARYRRQQERLATAGRTFGRGEAVVLLGAGVPCPRGIVQECSRRFVTVIRGEQTERWSVLRTRRDWWTCPVKLAA